jgi:hypothetical protein
MEHPPLHLGDDLARVTLIPVPVEMLGHRAKLDNKVARQVLGLDLAALLPPQPNRSRLIFPMMIRATEPPMKLRLVAEPAIALM